MSAFFQNTVVQHSNLCQPSTRLVAAAAHALENCLSLFSSICNEIKLNDRDTILPWGWQIPFLFLFLRRGTVAITGSDAWLHVHAFHHSFRNDVLGGEGRIPPKKKTSLINLSNLVKTLPWSVGPLLQERELLFVFKVLDCSSINQMHLFFFFFLSIILLLFVVAITSPDNHSTIGVFMLLYKNNWAHTNKQERSTVVVVQVGVEYTGRGVINHQLPGI